MCGICGKVVFGRGQNISEDDISRMSELLKHRGPDSSGVLVKKKVGLGFQRLSIIDLKMGQQPMSDISKRYHIIFNGEIYNYVEIKDELISRGYQFQTNTDTEVILNLYIEKGLNCLKKLRGMFSFVIWDEDKDILFCARDRFGKKPFYYSYNNSRFIFASELKSIKQELKEKILNKESLIDYFTYGYTLGDKTIYQGIKRLLPGHLMVISTKNNFNPKISQYWSLDSKPENDLSIESFTYRVKQTFEESVRLRLRSDVPLGAFLSGGLDSSAVVAVMSKYTDKPVKTFSIGFSEEDYSELSYARLVAKEFGTDHHEMILDSSSALNVEEIVRMYDEPLSDTSLIATSILSSFARNKVTVALSGDGGDEIFGGYNHYSKAHSIFKNNSLPPIARTFLGYLNKNFIPSWFPGKIAMYHYSSSPKFLPAFFSKVADYEREELFNKNFNPLNSYSPEKEKINLLQNNQSSDFISSFQKLDVQTFLAHNILTKVDIASMASSLEVRSPLLDHKLAELCFKIPTKFKVGKKSKKIILRKVMEDILPTPILKERKQGFGMPLDVWFSKGVNSFVNEILHNPNDMLYDYLDKEFVSDIIRSNQLALRSDFARKVWPIIIFNEWLNQNA